MSLNSVSQSYFQNMPEDLVYFLYTLLDPHSARALSQTDSVFKRIFSSEEMQRILIPIQFVCSLDPSNFPSIQYHKLLCARSKNAEILLEATLPWEQKVMCHRIANTKEFILTTSEPSLQKKNIKVVHLRTGEFITLDTKTSSVSCSCFDEQHRLVAIGFKGQSGLEFWDLNKRECIHVLDAKDDDIPFHSWQLSPDAKHAISVHLNEKPNDPIVQGTTLKLWDLDTRSCLYQLENISICLQNLKMISNSTKFLTVTRFTDQDNQMQTYSPIVWDFSTGQSKKIPFNFDFWNDSQRLTADNSKVLFVLPNHAIFCDVNTGKIIHTLSHKSISSACAINERGTLALTASESDKRCKIKLWDLTTGECLKIFFSSFKYIQQLEIDEVGLRCFAIDGEDCNAEIFDFTTGKCLQSFNFEFMEGYPFILSTDGTSAFCFDEDSAEIFNLAPLPIQRIIHLASCFIKDEESLESEIDEEAELLQALVRRHAYESFERFPSTVQTFVQEYLLNSCLEQNLSFDIEDTLFTLAEISDEKKAKSLLAYIEKEFVSDILEQFKKASLSMDKNANEAQMHLNNAYSLLNNLSSALLENASLQEQIQDIFLKKCVELFQSSIETKDTSLIFILIDAIKSVALPKGPNEDETSTLIESLEERIDLDLRSLFISAVLIYFQEAVIASSRQDDLRDSLLIQRANHLIQGSLKIKCLCLQACLNELKTHICSQEALLIALWLSIIELIDLDMHAALCKAFDEIQYQYEEEPFPLELFIKNHLNAIQDFQQTLLHLFHPFKRSGEELPEVDQMAYKRSRY